MKTTHKNLITAILIIIFILFGLNFNGINSVHALSPLTVDLGTAENFTILAKTAITTIGTTAITGDIGISPAVASSITGFGLVMDSSNTFSTSALLDGRAYASDYVAPTPANMTMAINDMEAAYNDAAGRPNPTATEIDSGILSSSTPVFLPGIYKWSTGVMITDSITLSGAADDIWIFQIAGDLSLAAKGDIISGTKILLNEDAKASNIFWQVGGGTGATLGTYSTFNGNILSAKQIIMETGAIFNGRAYSQSQITLDANNVSSLSATLHVVKLVINNNDGTASPSDFNIHVKKSNIDVMGSPKAGTSTPGTLYTLADGTYTVSEDNNSDYTISFSGDCDSSGNITLSSGDDKICTIINTDIPLPIVNYDSNPAPITPLIGIIKTSNPSSLLVGPGPVTYTYTVWNIGKQRALASIKLTDDKCSPVTYLSGDLNKNFKIEAEEIWKYSCTTNLSNTTTNTATVIGKSDDQYQQNAVATAIATVIVGQQTSTASSTNTTALDISSPLINIEKAPDRLTPFPFGGGKVIYTYTVTNPGIITISNISVTDNACSPVNYLSGDINNNSYLDPSEIWHYSCETKILISTKNTAMARGSANGLTAVDYAFATVLVSAPVFPDTGSIKSASSFLWNIDISLLFILLYSVFVFFVFKKYKS